jgi:hypothetical protein
LPYFPPNFGSLENQIFLEEIKDDLLVIDINYVNLNLESIILIYHEADFESIIISNLGRLVIITKAIITMNIKGRITNGRKHGNNCEEGWVQ